MPRANNSTTDDTRERYAHPFFTEVPFDQRPVVEELNASRMEDFIAQNLGPIPRPRTTESMALSDIIGAAGVREIETAGAIRFHATGDTGRQDGSSGDPQEDVAHAMTADFHPSLGGRNPAFFLHLGDVIYGHNKDLLYRDEFYRPYKNYPGKIIAVAGNHDGETYPHTDPKPCAAFLKNFCAAEAGLPRIATDVRIYRKTMTQPGVYWRLDAPFLDLVGLYSNIAEGPGFLSGGGGDESQKDWLKKVLRAIAADRATGKRKGLILAVHHPPFSAGGDHHGSPQLLADIDAACEHAGLIPDAVLSGHSHSYQRYSRKWQLGAIRRNIPFVVAGCGGHNAARVNPPNHSPVGDVTFESSRRGFGYLLVEAGPDYVAVGMHAVSQDGTAALFDKIRADF